MDQHRERERLQSGAETLGFLLTDPQLSMFLTFSGLLAAANQEFNLTRVSSEETVARHFLDSLTLGPVIRELGVTSLVDVGSGAGFPGLPLAIAFPEVKITLVDATKKRVEFISGVASDLGLKNATVVHGRAETLGRDPQYRDRFDLATARALAPLNLLLELLGPLVQIGGHVAVIKGESNTGQIAEALPIASLLGLAPRPTQNVAVPGGSRRNEIIIFGKASATPEPYPRSSQRLSRGPIKLQ